MRSFALIIAGLLAGVIAVVSCSDDSPGHADAAACECPAAEPPLSGRIRQVTVMQPVGANANGGQVAVCPAGAQLISGGCGGPVGSLPDIVIRQSLPSDGSPGWSCDVHNNELTPVTIRVVAFCLVPPQ
jgi:hypothetical protein